MASTKEFSYLKELADERIAELTKQGIKPNGPFDENTDIGTIALQTTAVRYEIRGLMWWTEKIKNLKDKKEGVFNDARL